LFCLVKGEESRGLAKVVEATDRNWTVEYFDRPGRVEIHSVPKTRIIRKHLGANTRIFHHDEATDSWLVGRVLKDQGDSVEVRFANKTDVDLGYDQLYVRWRKPISDPVEYLARAIAETPMYAEARIKFLEKYIGQRNACGGISALLSSAIELNSHQLDVVRRILSDASQRYLLADEVGLGKTIEAGVIIRQAVLDDPQAHKVVVLVPPTLVQQWRDELTIRFGLQIYLDISVFVCPQQLTNELCECLEGATMLVIDEAHHVASKFQDGMDALYRHICKATSTIDRLLLLSATPILRNETGFLRMLHLLDPVVYGLDSENSFREKVLHRQVLAEAVATLDPQNSLHLDSVLGTLSGIFPHDDQLAFLAQELKKQLVGVPNEDDPELIDAIRVLRAHISETYRLHRRILRNRRKHIRFLTPNRSAGTLCEIKGSGWGQLESALENWRINAVAALQDLGDREHSVEKVFSDFYCGAVEALLSDFGVLDKLCLARISLLAKGSINKLSTFDGEIDLLEDVRRFAVGYAGAMNSRLEQLASEIRKLIGRQVKVVVFCSESSQADTIYQYLSQAFGRRTIVRHEVADIDDTDGVRLPWLAFQSDSNTKVIVCDRCAEEGINLQGGRKAIVHFDLPFDPNRIEQRLGRLDRYGSGDPIPSIVLVNEQSRFQHAWYQYLDKGLGVFSRSISSLQYLIEDQLQSVRQHLLIEGIDALTDAMNALSGTNGLAEVELRLIDQQDGLDELAPRPETDLDEVADVDDDWISIRDATEKWVVDTLMFAHVPMNIPAGEAPVDRPFRFRYGIPGNGGRSALIPLSGFLDDFLGALDYEAPGANSRQPLSFAHSYHRKTAIKFGVRPLRYGCEFVEAVKSFSDLDDRGRSFAIWRYLRQEGHDEHPRMYFRFRFLVESNLDAVNQVVQARYGRSAKQVVSSIARRADALFPPFVEDVWINEEGQEPDQNFVDKFLDQPYNKDGQGQIYSDTNLKTTRLRYLIDNSPEIFGNWETRCFRMRDQALQLVLGRKQLADKICVATNRARHGDEIRFAQLNSRIRYLDGAEATNETDQLKLERDLGAALIEGIVKPAVSVDVAGMLMLTLIPFSKFENSAEGRD
jgi:ATP-dependent helicase HepA